jgi:hypothetical protein
MLAIIPLDTTVAVFRHEIQLSSGIAWMAVKYSTIFLTAVALLLLLSLMVGINLGMHGALHLADPGASNVPVNNVVVTLPPDNVDPVLTANLPTKVIAREVKNDIEKKEAREPAKESSRTSPPEEKRDLQTIAPSAVNSALEQISLKEDFSKLGPIERYIKEGKKIPVLMVTCNRPELLKTTLNSLLSVKGLSTSDIIVIQDGAMEEVSDIIKRHNLKLIQNTKGLRLRGGAGGMDGGSRIATHYKFALSGAFDENPEAPAVIVVEDDLLFSPDFYEYFHAIGPILENDKSILAVSAWNDNGFVNKVKDPFSLRRTGYFPGLGWMVSRQIYKGELESLWPTSHWDHWLRSPEINRNREIVHPEVIHQYHNNVLILLTSLCRYPGHFIMESKALLWM